MRILLCSYWFHPSFGGVESISKILAEEWTSAGHQVTVVTETAGESMNAPYTVVRQPSFMQLRRLGDGVDIIVQNIIGLRTLGILLLCRKPIVVIHNSWLRRNDGKRGWQEHLKLLFTRTVTNVAISRPIAESLPVPSQIIGNPFATEEFRGLRDRPRSKELVYMGRLVSDKGVDTLLEAMGQLRVRKVTPTLTIIGDGPEMPKLQGMVRQLSLTDQVTFTGALREGRGSVVARHKVLVVPSRWAEPFGIVALEGIASGCAIVASEQGGLPEAAGPCGFLFPNGDISALARALERVLGEETLQARLIAAGPDHLKQFEAVRVARRYLDLFERLLKR